MSDFTKLAKEVVKIAKTKRDKKPSSFDTEGKVNRIDRDNKIAWVKFAEGEDETPVQMTIDVVPGDRVRIRESGHKAWIAGNVTHPPTDATGAINYINASVKSINAKFENTENQIGDINTEIEDLKHKVVVKVVTEHCFATARSIPAGGDFDDIKAEGYDWTEEELEYPTGLSYTLYYWVRTVTYYSDGSSEISGPVFDVSAQVSKEAKDVGNAAKEVADTVTEDLESLENYFWNTDTDGVYVANKKDLTESSVNVRSNTIVIRRDGKIASNYAASGINFYDGKGSSTITDDLLASYTRSGINLYTKNAELSPVNKNSRAASFTPSGLTLWDPSDTTDTDTQRKEAIFGSNGVYLYGTDSGSGGVTRNPLIASFTTGGISFNTDYDMTVGDANRYIKWKKNTQSLEIVTDSLYIGGNPVQPTSVGSLLRSGYSEAAWLIFSSVGYEDEWTNGDNGIDTGKIPYPVAKDSTITINGYATDSGNYWQVIGRVTQTVTSGNIPAITISAESNPKGDSGGTTDSQYMTYDSSFGLRVYSGPKTDGTFANAYTQIKSDGITLVRNNSGTPQQIATFGSTAQIGPTAGNHFIIANNKLQGWSNSTNMFFEVSSTEMKFGSNLSVATTAYADNAKTSAINTAAADATTKANNAQTNAISTAAADATSKANAAQTNAINTAAADATSKANAAETNAISTAAADATSKANAAKTSAINTAAADATTKANNAAKTATTYITAIDNDGIKVHANNNPSSNYAKINADGLTVFRSGNDVATFGASARIGQNSSNHLLINSSAISFYKDANYRSFWISHTASSIFKQCIINNYSIEGDSTKSKNEITISSGKISSSSPDTASIRLRSTSTAPYYGEVRIFGGASDGYVEIEPKLIIDGHSSEVGSIITATNTKSIATTSSFVTSGCSLTIPAGSWVICYGASWAEDSTTTSGRRAVELYTSSYVSYTRIVTPAGISSDIQQRGAFPVNRSSSTTYYVYVLQNSGKSISCTANIYAIRVA